MFTTSKKNQSSCSGAIVKIVLVLIVLGMFLSRDGGAWTLLIIIGAFWLLRKTLFFRK